MRVRAGAARVLGFAARAARLLRDARFPQSSILPIKKYLSKSTFADACRAALRHVAIARAQHLLCV